MEYIFASRARNDRIPIDLLWIGFFGLLAAGQIIICVIDDQEDTGALLGAVVLDFLDVA